MTQRLLHIAVKPTPDDVADALAIAICTTHSNMNKVWSITR
jgi:crossover junction endodeoxyribonuclease RuvC